MVFVNVVITFYVCNDIFCDNYRTIGVDLCKNHLFINTICLSPLFSNVVWAYEFQQLFKGHRED